jgi:hypothetical protein
VHVCLVSRSCAGEVLMAAWLSSMQAATTRTTVVLTTENATDATSSASKVRLTAFAPATSNERLRSCMHPGSVAQRSH